MTQYNVDAQVVRALVGDMREIFDELDMLAQCDVFDSEKMPRLTTCVLKWESLNPLTKTAIRGWSKTNTYAHGILLLLDRLTDALPFDARR